MKQLLLQRSQATMAEQAQKDAAFQAQVAQTQAVRAAGARTKAFSADLAKQAGGAQRVRGVQVSPGMANMGQDRTIQLPDGVIGQTEGGAAIRNGQGPSRPADVGQVRDNDNIARRMATFRGVDPGDFDGKDMVQDLPDIIQKSLQYNDIALANGRIDANMQKGLAAARGTPAAPFKYGMQGMQDGDVIPERDIGLLQGTLETPLGLGQPGQASVHRGEDGDWGDFLRQLQSQLPMQGPY
jgi:hypothetical protein